MKYQPPYQEGWPNVPDPDEGYTNANPPEGLEGSVPPAEAFEFPMREIVNLITYGGYIPDDGDLAQMTRAVRRAKYAFATDTGSVNQLNIAVDPPLLAYEQGTELRVLVANDNGGPSTIRVNGLPAAQILRRDGSGLVAGDLRRGGIASLIHDGANFQLVSGTSGNVTIGGAGWFNGADYIVDTGTVNHIVGTPPIAPTSYQAGQGFCILVKNANTGPVDINVNSLGVIPLKLPGNVDLSAGDIHANMLIYVRYDGTAFKMLSPIWLERIASAMTFIVGPNAGADFADLNVALAWLARRRIADNGTVNLSLQGATSGPAMIHTYSVGVIVAHPDGNKLTISGPSPAFIPRAGNFTANGYVQANIDADSNTNVAMLRNAFRTELRFTSAAGLVIRANGMTLTNVLVTHGSTMGTSAAGATGIAVQSAKLNIACVASAICTSCTWAVDVGASVVGSDFYAVGSSLFSIGMSHNSSIVIGNASTNVGSFVVAGAYVDGCQATMAAILQVDVSDRARFLGIGQWAMNHWGSSAFHMINVFAYMCAWGLAQVNGVATNYSALSQISYTNQGVSASQGSYVDWSNGYAAACTSYTHFAAHLAGIYGAGFQNTWVTSPARNAFGNGGAYIEG